MIEVSRRSLLSGMAAAALPTAFAATGAAVSPIKQLTIEEAMATASPAERVRYHTAALIEAMDAMHPGERWRSQIDHELKFVLIAPSLKVKS